MALGQLFEGATRQPACDDGSNLLHLVEVHIEVGTAFPIGSVGDDFPPLSGQFFQRRELFG